ncbi:NAD-dependent epimerase/dehydratase family protein [Gaetbulibacter aestuarii]|uniref:NAD-dependent epimerase/dehydratase family protein n=1 Tax=Gaetbulibacter aestuarii TaxID=1502358 RepID=A0ABW7MY14_9FLAO
MKAFLTGATGYIGHQLALELARMDITVHALVRDLESPKIPEHKNIIPFEGDICNDHAVYKAMQHCDYVFHTAAFTNLNCTDISCFYETNVLGTENILKVALELKIKKVIYTSTLSVFGPSYKTVPIIESQPRLTSYANDYELTKSMAEELVERYINKGLSCVTLCVTKVYGPGLNTFSNGVNRLIRLMLSQRYLLVPDRLHVSSNYVFIKDVIQAHILAMKPKVVNEKFIIGGENTDYANLFELIKIMTRSKVKIIKVNYKILRSVFSILNILQVVFKMPIKIRPQVLDALFVHRVSSSGKAIEKLKYEATQLKMGLEHTINHIKLQS